MENENENEIEGLQSEDGNLENPTTQIPGEEPGSESETETETEQKPFINQEAVNKAIGRQNFKFQEEKRKRITAEQKLATLQQQAPVDTRPVIPDLPNTYDSDFEAKLLVRDTAIKEQATWDANQAAQQQQTQQAQQNSIVNQQETIRVKAEKFDQRADKLGLDKKKLDTDGNTVIAYGLTPEVADHLLTIEEGPLVVSYLAANLTELEALASLPPMAAAARLSSIIIPEAKKLKPAQSTAPNPPETLTGGNAPANQSKFLEGVVME